MPSNIDILRSDMARSAPAGAYSRYSSRLGAQLGDTIPPNIVTNYGNLNNNESVTYYSNPSRARLEAAGLPLGAATPYSSVMSTAEINFSGGTGTGKGKDWRVKIASPALNYSGLLSPLNQSRGIVFPNTPQVTVVHQANYSPQKFTHSNYPAYAYEGSEVQAIQVTGDFAAQNKNEAKYVLACIYFLRSATKMFFGQDSNAGNPPPLVFLDGYGEHYFPHVPCIVTQFSHTLPQDVDYIDSDGTRIPTVSQLTAVLQPLYSKKTIADSFSLEKFSSGSLIGKGFI